jgi:hypothetical protein
MFTVQTEGKMVRVVIAAISTDKRQMSAARNVGVSRTGKSEHVVLMEKCCRVVGARATPMLAEQLKAAASGAACYPPSSSGARYTR